MIVYRNLTQVVNALEALINQWGSKIMAGVDQLKQGVADVEATETATATMLTNLQSEITQLKAGTPLTDAEAAALGARLEAAIAPVQALVNPPPAAA
jgi:uncharacterized phage infection (PIP) family protein YhgE